MTTPPLWGRPAQPAWCAWKLVLLCRSHGRPVQWADRACYATGMGAFYGQDLAFIHAEAFERLATAAAETLLARLTPVPNMPVLDLGCGAGPLSQRLHARGIPTWGLDISPELVRLAQARLPDVPFTCGSVLTTPLPRAAAAVAIGEVLNYATVENADALATVFARVADALPPGGHWLFDLAGPTRGGMTRAFTEQPGWAVGMVADDEAGLHVRRITTFRAESGGAWRRAYEEHRLRLWDPQDVLARLAAAGFRAGLLDGYQGMAMPPGLHVYLATRLPV